MTPALAVVASIVVVLLVLLAVRQFMHGLRARGRAAIDQRFAASDVHRVETSALSFGESSRGVTQARGTGALALTTGELFFMLYVPTRELRIPLSSIKAVSLVRSHLGKTQFTDLLHVSYTVADADDAVAWRVPEPAAWVAEIDARRGASRVA